MPKTPDPQYVRLATRLSRSVLADVGGSGWSLSGLDVKEFPSRPDAKRFCRKALRDGKLEAASKAEYDEVRALDAGSGDNSRTTHQESRVQSNALRAHRKLADKRAKSAVGDEDDADDLDDDDDEDADDATNDVNEDEDEDSSEAGDDDGDEQDDDEDDDESESPAPAKKAAKKSAKAKTKGRGKRK